MERLPVNEFGEPNMGNPSVRFDEGRGECWSLAAGPFNPAFPAYSTKCRVAPVKLSWHVGESPTRRVGLFTTELDLNSAAARRGWKLRKENRRAVMKMNHI